MGNKIKLILALGIALRLVLAATTYHSDVAPFLFAGKVISQGNISNFYDYLGNLPEESPVRKVYPTYLFNYPPVVYFGLGPVTQLLTLPFGESFLNDFIFNFRETLGDFRLNLLLLTLKLPYLAFDLPIAYVLFKLFQKPKNKLLALSLWMFNPINLYATYMMGAYDVIPTFFVVLAIFLANKRKDVARNNFLFEAFILGLGASFKIFPFLFLAPLSFLKTSWMSRFKIIATGVLTYVVLMLPFLASPGFRRNALIAGQTMKSFYANIPISGGEAIYLFPLFILFFYLIFLFTKNITKTLWSKFFLLLLIFFIFTHWHLQWFLWLTPFLVIDLVKSKFKHWSVILLMGISFLVLLTFFDPGLSMWLFAPVFPNLYGSPGIWSLIGLNLDINFMRGIFQTIFVSSAAYYIYYYFPERPSHELEN